MKIILDIPELEHYQHIRWDTMQNFKAPCPYATRETLHGFPFKEHFAAFEKSGEPTMQGVIMCMEPSCREHITFTMRREE